MANYTETILSLTGVELYALESGNLTRLAGGSLAITPSVMTGYRLTIKQQGEASVTWVVQDCTPVLKAGQSTFVFPKNTHSEVFWILDVEGTSEQLTKRLTYILEERCTLLFVEGEELTEKEWEDMLNKMTKSANYSSRVARSVTNASLTLSTAIGGFGQTLQSGLAQGKQHALTKWTKQKLDVDPDVKVVVKGIGQLIGLTLSGTQSVLSSITAPIKKGVTAGVAGVKELVNEVKAELDKDAPAIAVHKQDSDKPKNINKEVLDALLGAVQVVAGSAISNGKQVATVGLGSLKDVVDHRFGEHVTALGVEGVMGVVKLAQTIGAVKTFGLLNLSKHTIEETAKHVLSQELSKAGDSKRGVFLTLSVSPEGYVEVHIGRDTRLVEVTLTRTQHFGDGGARGVISRRDGRVRVTLTVIKQPAPPSPDLAVEICNFTADIDRAIQEEVARKQGTSGRPLSRASTSSGLARVSTSSTASCSGDSTIDTGDERSGKRESGGGEGLRPNAARTAIAGVIVKTARTFRPPRQRSGSFLEGSTESTPVASWGNGGVRLKASLDNGFDDSMFSLLSTGS